MLHRISFLFVLIAMELAFLLSIIPATHQVLGYDASGTLDISASVLPSPTAFTITISSDQTEPVSQNGTVKYTISYISNNTTSTPLTFQAQWYQGTIDGAPNASVNVVDYKTNTATTGYGNAGPVVNLNDRTLTWTITTLPANSGRQTVTFELNATDNYSGSKKVTFPVAARIIHPAALADVSTELTYQYLVPTQTTSSSPSPSPSAVPLSTISTEKHASITAIRLLGIDSSSAKVQFQTDATAKLIVSYGKTPALLGNWVGEKTATTVHSFTLSDLTVDTRYYFRIFESGNDSNGLPITVPISDVFVFDTASANRAKEGASWPILMTAAQSWGVTFSQDVSTAQPGVAPSLIAITGSILDLQFIIPNSEELKNATILVRIPGVLGITTDNNNDDFQSKTTTPIEIGKSIFVGKVKLPTNRGVYQIVLRTEDIYGNIDEKSITDVTVIQPMQILDAKGRRASGAVVLISRFNERSQLFQVLPNTATSLKNPVTSDEDGIVHLSLLPGKYQAQITLNGYVRQEVAFMVDPTLTTDFPQITLQLDGNWATRFIQSQKIAVRNANGNLYVLFDLIITSSGFFIWMIVVNLLLTGALVWMALSALLRTSVWLLPVTLLNRSKRSSTELKAAARKRDVRHFIIAKTSHLFFEFILVFSLLSTPYFLIAEHKLRGVLFLLLVFLNIGLWGCCEFLKEQRKFA